MTSSHSSGSDAVTPLRREFDHVWSGFDRDQVRDYVADLETTIRRVVADRDASRAQVNSLTDEVESLRAETGRLQERIEELRCPPENLEDLDERMQRVGHLAHLQAEEITTRAQAAAEEQWQESAQASLTLRERYRSLLRELDAHAEQLHAAHRAALEETKVETQKLTTDAVHRREQLDAEEERKRRVIEEEFDASMAAQREDLEKYIADQQSASRNQAQRRLAEAADEATELMANARREAERSTADAQAVVDDLAAVTERTTTRLAEADQLLAESESALEPLDEEFLPVPRAEDDGAGGAGPSRDVSGAGETQFSDGDIQDRESRDDGADGDHDAIGARPSPHPRRGSR